MSESRETTLNASPSARAAEDEARDLPLTEVLAHRRHHHDDRGERVGCGRRPGPRGAVELARVEGERGGCGLEDGRVREHLAELDLAVAVEIRLDALRHVLGARAPEHALGEVEEVARLAEHATVGELEVERHGARRILRRARAGVEDDVVDRERRRPGDDAFDALVVRVALDPERLRPGEDRLHVERFVCQSRA